jgi:hypothetical protein
MYGVISFETRVETKMHFCVFAKMRKSEMGRFYAKFHEILFHENVSFPQKFRIFFAKIFAKTKNPDFCINFRENLVYFCKNFRANLVLFCRNFRENEKHRFS